MSYISPRSLKLLEDIVNESDNRATNDDLVESSHQSADLGSRVENMTEPQTGNFDDTLNFFEKLERENGPVSNGHVQNGHVENGVREEGEESEEESYTVNEFSETTADTTFDNDTSSSSLPQRRRGRGTKVTHKKDFNQNYLSTKTSSLREGSTDRDSASDRIETMSDSGRVGRQQRKLNKRAQMREFRTIGLEPLESAEERLEQKYMELQQLVSGQFMEQKVALTHNHIQQMELLRQQYAIASHGLPPTGVLVPRSMPAQFRNRSYNRHKGDKENLQHPASEDEAYNTIRTLQTTNAGQRRSRARTARTRPLSATRMNQSRSTSRERHEKTPDKRPTTANEEGQQRSRQRKKSRSRSNSRSRSSSGSPRPGTDTFLKNSENEFVRDWVKRKDLEFRRKRAEEKKRKRLERKEKIEKQIEIEERYKDSKLIVQQWMRQKKRESFRRKKHEKAVLSDEASRRAYERAKTVSGIHGLGVNRPMSAPGPIRTERSKLRVQRPGTTDEEVQEKQEQMVREAIIGYIETEASAELPLDEEPPSPSTEPVQQEFPQPPVTKYVYRRPVLGKVRLRMGKYQQAPEETKPPPSPGKKPMVKPLSKEEIERNQRISYDDWLQVKRKEDDEKKKEMQRQNELTQSEPKYERPIPDLVQNAEGNVLQGRAIAQRHPRGRVLSQEEQEDIREQARRKKHVLSIEEEINATFDIRSESPEQALDRVAKDIVKYVLKSVSSDDGEVEEQEGYFEDEDEAEHEGLASLHVVGSKAPMSSRGRPMSASAAGIPFPQSSKSPRRPASAQPKPGWTGDSSQRVPFPPDNHYQNNRMLFNSNGGERPEPQGSDASDPRGLYDGQDRYFTSEYNNDDERSDALDLNSITSSKKRVSFCEETTVFDESEVEEDLDDWGNLEEDSADLQKARSLFNFMAENPDSEGGVVITKTDEVDV
ncbi:apical junction molecule-like [Haliotis rubra]|uniref:apical junction molecule-like n=1 Tax=Haliotis rubra TaxID=36100 RepID=UPI001EE516EB|nr:apical junction molecule-like [Haliotis rubra]XP_046573731.1 apical junction molecule-like [Haliotis rubra]XP_046573732.1 apical junction molecule-like [Haliotis rubra]